MNVLTFSKNRGGNFFKLIEKHARHFPGLVEIESILSTAQFRQ